jgi:hypothetical protein
MNSGAVAGVLAGLLLGPLQNPPPPAPPDPPSRQEPTFQAPILNTERIESGELRSATGETIAYRIRLLPIASFPGLPTPVAQVLMRRQCMIPQSFEAKQPENVIHGSFRAPGSNDWAALCSLQGTTTLYVFFAGQFESPLALRSQADSTWLEAAPGDTILGSSWGIAVRSAAELRASPQLHHGATLDHDAIDDARLERSLIVHYYQAGRWLDLNHSDGSD